MTTGVVPRDYAMLVPPGWYRVPLDDRLPLRIKQIADQRTGSLAPLDRDGARTLITRLLSEETAQAKQRGGLDLFLNLDPIKGMVVPASCLVMLVPVDGRATDDLTRALLSTDSDTTVLSLGVVEVAGESAVRRETRKSFAAALVGTDDEGEEAPARELDVVVPIPMSKAVLLFTFATPDTPVADAMVQLFDTMVGNLRWVS